MEDITQDLLQHCGNINYPVRIEKTEKTGQDDQFHSGLYAGLHRGGRQEKDHG